MDAIVDFGKLQFIRGERKGNYPYCNSLFLPQSGVLIDPASNRDYLKSLGRKKVQSIWLSHWHEDHIMHLDLFEQIPIWMHKADEAPLRDIETFIDWYGVEPGDHDHLRANWHKMLRELFHFQPRQASRYLKDGEVIDLGGATAEVIHTPGHSPGHIAFFFPEPKILYLGDYDLTRFGPWYGDLYSRIDQIIESINKLRQVPADILLAAHGEGVFENPADSVWDDYLGVIDRREEMLFEALQEPQTIEEIGSRWIIYGKPVEPVEEYEMMERIQMKKHADRLIAKGAVKFEDGYYSRT